MESAVNPLAYEALKAERRKLKGEITKWTADFKKASFREPDETDY